jgi:hypothetical protein
MAINISCSPNKTLVRCARIATVVIQDPTPNEECLYLFGFSFPAGISDIATPKVVTPNAYVLKPNMAYNFLIKADKPGTLTMKAVKSCNDPRLNETALADYEVLDCSDDNAKSIGIFTGIGTATITLTIIAGTKLGGGIGSVGGPIGIGLGLVIGAAAGVGAYFLFRPDCCTAQATIVAQGSLAP